MIYCFYFTPNTIIAIIGLFVGIGTLTLGIIAYHKFLSKQIRQKQLDTICGLVEEIQKNFNIYFFNKGGTSKKSGWRTFLDVSEMPQFDNVYNKLYFFGSEPDDQFEEVLNWDFFNKYYSNPLLPKKIADKLRPFNITHWHSVQYKTIQNDDCIIIGRKGIITPDTPCLSINDSTIETCEGFKTAIVELRKSLEDWFKSYGIKDLNITTSHHYRNKE